jgi:hypothetical protein
LVVYSDSDTGVGSAPYNIYEQMNKPKEQKVYSGSEHEAYIFNVNSGQETRLFLTPNPSPSHAFPRTKERGFSLLSPPSPFYSYQGEVKPGSPCRTRERVRKGLGVRARTQAQKDLLPLAFMGKCHAILLPWRPALLQAS